MKFLTVERAEILLVLLEGDRGLTINFLFIIDIICLLLYMVPAASLVRLQFPLYTVDVQVLLEIYSEILPYHHWSFHKINFPNFRFLCPQNQIKKRTLNQLWNNL